MVWGIGSIYKSNNPAFRALSWRLLIYYLTIMMAILSTSLIGVYEFFALTLYQQLDRQLLTLADAAAHILPEIQEHQSDINSSLLPHFDNDGDLDIPWQTLQQPSQGVEWFDKNQQKIVSAGGIFPNKPLPQIIHPDQIIYSKNNGQVRSLVLSVYQEKQEKKFLMGYVRTSESTEEIEMILNQLKLGMIFGGLLASSLTAFGGMWLTKQSLKPVEKSFEKLKQFTADASHELRNPLAAIRACVEVMQSHPERIHPQDIDKLNAIASGTHQMSNLVEDLLLLARSDQDPVIPSRWVLVPLDELLEDLVDFISTQAEKKHLKIINKIEPLISIKGNGDQLWRLFLNLLENAIDYTEDGGKITVSLQQEEKWIVVEIQDTGIGMAPEHLPYIFDRLWRADQSRTRREKGYGLGLAIAQTIADHHQGKITVTSELGKGSCFTIRFPTVKS